MKIGSALAIYLLIWSICGFLVLPFGVRTHEEAGTQPVPGQADSAPHAPMMAKKLIATTLLSILVFLLFYLNYVNGWIGLSDILPSLDPRR